MDADHSPPKTGRGSIVFVALAAAGVNDDQIMIRR